jgi:hypothetical protein
VAVGQQRQGVVMVASLRVSWAGSMRATRKAMTRDRTPLAWWRCSAGVAVYVQPTVTFVYPSNGPVSEDTPVREVLPILRSALAAEQQAERSRALADAALSCDWGGSTALTRGNDQPRGDFGATLHISDAGRALLSPLSLPSGIYNVCRDGERVSNERFTRVAGLHPQQ